ncbi:sensor histidine kinase [Roseivirga echinicomitans]|nr:histidine kinase [Roseivirga echinicomitans]
MAISYGTAQTYASYYLSVDVGTSVFFYSAGGVANTASDFLVVYGLSTCLFFINEWYIKERKLRELETQKLQAELDLLKGQINPHFLFNALNTVHVLIKKDQDLARQTLERFSDLLSHQIYEVNNEVIPLKNEIDNLSNYIHLQKMRFENQMEVKWKVNGKLSDLVISPMLFLNFVENAFKHGDNVENGRVMIEIRMSVMERRMDFTCSNSIVAGKKQGNVLGVGIANVKRRLELIYPERHELTIGQTENLFSVHLILKLDEV